jgi:hypothetical protein
MRATHTWPAAVTALAAQVAVGRAEPARCSQVWWNDQLTRAALIQREAPAGRVSQLAELAPYVAAQRRAVAPALAIYREACAQASPEQRLLAAYQLGEAYLAIAARVRIALPPGPADDPSEADRFWTMHRMVEPMLAPYEHAAARAFADAAELADAMPRGVPADEVVRTAVARIDEVLERL